MPKEWLAHPKDLIPLAETNSAARKRELTDKLKQLSEQISALETEKRLALKKEDFVKVKEIMPQIEQLQQTMEELKKPELRKGRRARTRRK